MAKRRIKCENCGFSFSIVRGIKEFTCPCCNKEYDLSDDAKETNKFKVLKDYEQEAIEDLKLFHYEYVSTEPNKNNNYVWINVKRSKNFKHRTEILKLEEEYQSLKNEFDNVTYEIENAFPANVCVILCLSVPVSLCWIPLMIFFNINETWGKLAGLIEVVLSITIIILICKLVQINRVLNYKLYLKTIMKKIDKMYNDLEELNK